MSISEFKKEFDPILESVLDNKLERILSLSKDSFIKNALTHSKNLVFPGGKRIRPYLAFLTYSAFGGVEKEKAYRLLSSLEIFHTFALIHDDIMDKSETRHGAKTVHSDVREALLREKRLGDFVNTANSQAILIGDIYFGWAAEVFNGTDFDKEKIAKARTFFYKMIDEVALGQMVDIDLSTKHTSTDELIEEKIRMKTTMYTFIRPLQIGACLSETSDEIEKFCEEFGGRLGFSFQMQDDLLDIIGDSKKMKKDTMRDISSRQHTFFTNYVFNNGAQEQKKYLSEIFGKEVPSSEKKKIENLFRDSGAVEKGEEKIKENLDKAREILNSFGGLADKKDFEKLIEALENRGH